MISCISLSDLPGAEFALPALDDLARGTESIGSLLLEIGAPRLRGAGLPLPDFPASSVEAELRLYRRLQPLHGDEAHAQYNAWLRRLGRFTRALERQRLQDHLLANDPANLDKESNP